MEPDANELRRHYEWLSDAALFAIDRNELVEKARRIYDEETARRQRPQEKTEENQESASDGPIPDPGPEPEWLASSGVAFETYMPQNESAVDDVAEVRRALSQAQFPSYVILRTYPSDDGAPPVRELSVMVPGETLLSAMSLLDIEIFNPREEKEYRESLANYTDEQFHSVSPDDFCAGLLDRAARLRRAYEDEAARREAKREHEAQSA